MMLSVVNDSKRRITEIRFRLVPDIQGDMRFPRIFLKFAANPIPPLPGAQARTVVQFTPSPSPVPRS